MRNENEKKKKKSYGLKTQKKRRLIFSRSRAKKTL
jgi:hypothetical protein